MKETGRIRERYDFSFDARQLGLVLSGVFAVAALVFALGVSVGIQWERRKAAEFRQVRILTPAAAVPKGRSAQAPSAPPVLSPVTTALTGNEENAAGAGQGDETDAGPLTFPKVLTSNSRKTAPLTPEKKSSRAAGPYTVQVGAYKDKRPARDRAERLKKKGYDARVYSGGGRKGEYAYKVHVGLYESREEAAKVAKRLQSSEKTTVYVTLER
ncbi:MAG TPA: SPOR domain-containing protein [Nitrospirota bacterium]|nr:SPOR domain-containing protein [Nitrospirota bacterium]